MNEDNKKMIKVIIVFLSAVFILFAFLIFGRSKKNKSLKPTKNKVTLQERDYEPIEIPKEKIEFGNGIEIPDIERHSGKKRIDMTRQQAIQLEKDVISELSKLNITEANKIFEETTEKYRGEHLEEYNKNLPLYEDLSYLQYLTRSIDQGDEISIEMAEMAHSIKDERAFLSFMLNFDAKYHYYYISYIDSLIPVSHETMAFKEVSPFNRDDNPKIYDFAKNYYDKGDLSKLRFTINDKPIYAYFIRDNSVLSIIGIDDPTGNVDLMTYKDMDGLINNIKNSTKPKKNTMEKEDLLELDKKLRTIIEEQSNEVKEENKEEEKERKREEDNIYIGEPIKEG